MALADSQAEVQRRAALVRVQPPGRPAHDGRTTRRLRELGIADVAVGPEVLALLNEGLRNSEIAKQLSLSEKTVGHHVSAILAKLEVDSRGEAVRKARTLFPVAVSAELGTVPTQHGERLPMYVATVPG